MMEALEYFDLVGQSIEEGKRSNMFGSICYKVGRRPFIIFQNNRIVCKLFDEVKQNALALTNTSFFNPMGGEKAMENWVEIPMEHKDYWEEYAIYALEFVKSDR